MLTPDDAGFLDLDRDGVAETINRVVRVAAQFSDDNLDSLIPWVLEHFNPAYHPWSRQLLEDLEELRRLRDDFAAEIAGL